MKSSSLLVMLAAIAGAGSSPAAPPPDGALRQAEVTLPFEEVRSLLEKSRANPPPAPPIPAAVTRAQVALILGDKNPTATAEFEVTVLTAGWQLVPLLATPFALSATAPAEIAVVSRDGMLCLLASGPGRFSGTLTFDVPASPVAAGGPGFTLRLAPAAAGKITVRSLPPHSRVGLRSADQPETSGPLPIPPQGGEVTLRVIEDIPVAPTIWTADVQTLVTQRDDRLSCEAHLRLTGDTGSGAAAQLDLPADATSITINGLDLAPPRFQGGGGKKFADLAWHTPGILARDLVVRYDLPPPADETWTLRPILAVAAKSSRSRTLVTPLPGISLSGKSGRLIDDLSDLPAWMGGLARGDGAFEVRSTQPFDLSARMQPRLVADTARISLAEFRSRLEGDGARLCEARLAFEHRGSLRWSFTLPKGSELLSCEVGGRAVNPLIREDGRLELALASHASPDTATSSRVAFSYTERGPALAPVEGKLALALPATPLFVEALEWTLELPAGYEATAFEGNVAPAGDGRAIRFNKRLVRNEAAALEIYYRKRPSNP